MFLNYGFILIIFFEIIKNILTINVHATGKVKFLSMTACILYVLIPFIVYGFFLIGLGIDMAFLTLLLTNVILCLSNLLFVKIYTGLNVFKYITTIVYIVILATLSLTSSLLIKRLIPDTYVNIITNTIISIALSSFLFYTFLLNKQQRLQIINRIRMIKKI